MNSFSERLKEAMSLKKVSQTELCERTGIPKSAMSQYLSGAFTPKQKRTYLIAHALDINEAWLLGYPDVGISPSHPALSPTELRSNTKPVPLLGRVAAGLSCHAEDNIEGYILTDCDILSEGYDYFWLTVKGDSMEPELRDGDRVLIREQETLDSECYAVVRIDGEDGVVKRVRIDIDRITLTSVNPYYPPRVFEREKMNDVAIVGKVIESKRSY